MCWGTQGAGVYFYQILILFCSFASIFVLRHRRQISSAHKDAPAIVLAGNILDLCRVKQFFCWMEPFVQIRWTETGQSRLAETIVQYILILVSHVWQRRRYRRPQYALLCHLPNKHKIYQYYLHCHIKLRHEGTNSSNKAVCSPSSEEGGCQWPSSCPQAPAQRYNPLVCAYCTLYHS